MMMMVAATLAVALLAVAPSVSLTSSISPSPQTSAHGAFMGTVGVPPLCVVKGTGDIITGDKWQVPRGSKADSLTEHM